MSTLVLSPAMAQEAEEIHEQALKVLRAQIASSRTNTPAGLTNRPSIGESRRIEGEVRRDRNEREMRLQEEAAAARARRDAIQAAQRQEFEQQMRARDQVRQQHEEHDEMLARGAKGEVSTTTLGMDPEEVHRRALEVLRGGGAAGTTTSAAPVVDAEPAIAATPTQEPRPAQPAAEPEPEVARESPEELHRRALEILRQGQPAARPAPPSTPPPAATPAPRAPQAMPRPEETRAPQGTPTQDEYVKDLERRALQAVRREPASMPVEQPVASRPAPAEPAPARQPALQPAASPTPRASTPPRNIREMHEQALQVLRQQETASSSVVDHLDPEAREIIQRQNREIAREAGVPSRSIPATPPVAARASQPPYAGQPAHPLAPEMEQRAREILRQQQAQVTATPSAAMQPMARPAPAARSAPTAPATDQYSRELEERARQILRERAQTQERASTPAPATPAPAPAQPAPPAAQPEDPDAVHARALEALRQQAEAAPAAPLTKRDKLRALTDLYKADLIGSVEYHQKRAKILAEPGE